MTRKERQAKKQLTIIHKSNEENRLPVGARATHIDGGSVESDDDFKELKSKQKFVLPRAKNFGVDVEAVDNDSEEARETTFRRSKTLAPQPSVGELNFDVMDDPDYPPEAVNSNIIVEEIEMNGRIQKIYKKTYYLIDGKTINITRMEQA